jgi:hypothetical protein
MCTTEALKWVTACGPPIKNNLLFSGDSGIFMQHFEFARRNDCEVCSLKLTKVPAVGGETVKQLLERLEKDFGYPAKSLTANNGATRLYMPILEVTHVNLDLPVSNFVASGDVLMATAGGAHAIFEFILE